MRTTIVNRRTAVAAIADRAPFRNSGGTFHGRPADESDAYAYTGRLNSTDAEALRKGLSAGEITYVVWSYSTPIAWAYADGRTVVTDQRFSPTTSGHQGIARVALTVPADGEYVAWSRAGRR